MSFKQFAKQDPVIVATRARAAATEARQKAQAARAQANQAAAVPVTRWNRWFHPTDSAQSAQHANELERYADSLEATAVKAEKAAQPVAAAPSVALLCPATFNASEVAVLRARAIEAAAQATAAHLQAAGDPQKMSSGETTGMWDRARTFNRTGGRR